MGRKSTVRASPMVALVSMVTQKVEASVGPLVTTAPMGRAIL